MIDCKDIEFTYDGHRLALAGVNLHIDAGSFVCVLGGNGSGKSTLAKHFNALLVPDKGHVTVDGYKTSDSRMVYNIRSTAGMVFQNPDDQLVASLVEDDVAFGPENLGVETAELSQRVRQALKEVGLVGFEKSETHTLSGGQKQRVAIAGVLAMQPKVLILDEASAMLDPRGRKGLMRVCKELNERGITIIMITHFMEEAAQADRVIILDHGKIAQDGTPKDVLTKNDVLTGLNLDVPFAGDLSTKLQALGLAIPTCVDEDRLATEVLKATVNKGLALSSSSKTADLPAETSADRAATADAVEAAVSDKTATTNTNNVTASADALDALNVSPEPVITFEDVWFTYSPVKKERKRNKDSDRSKSIGKQADWGNDPNALWALHDVSFSVHSGEFFGIAGHTGSGKSTLIQHMNGILRPTRGRVLVRGKNVAEAAKAASVRADVGVVFQYPEHQLFADSVYNDVAFGPRNLKLPLEEVDERVREALSLVGLDFDELHEINPFELSGGQQRRVAFAGVLAMRPSILVLDEPAAGLDPAARHSSLNLVANLHSSGRTVVMISHSMDDLARLCDRILVLNEGEPYTLGTPQEVFLRAEDLNNIGLGIPAAQHMANRLIAAGVPLSKNKVFDGDSLANELAHIATTSDAASAGSLR